MEGEPKDALGQLKDLSEQVNDNWAHVRDYLRQATYELIEIDEETHAALELDFWHEHVRLLERTEATKPGTAAAVFDRFEEVAASERAADKSREQVKNEFFERELRKYKVKAFMKGLLGLPVEPITYEELMARQKGDGIADL